MNFKNLSKPVVALVLASFFGVTVGAFAQQQDDFVPSFSRSVFLVQAGDFKDTEKVRLLETPSFELRYHPDEFCSDHKRGPDKGKKCGTYLEVLDHRDAANGSPVLCGMDQGEYLHTTSKLSKDRDLIYAKLALTRDGIAWLAAGLPPFAAFFIAHLVSMTKLTFIAKFAETYKNIFWRKEAGPSVQRTLESQRGLTEIQKTRIAQLEGALDQLPPEVKKQFVPEDTLKKLEASKPEAEAAAKNLETSTEALSKFGSPNGVGMFFFAAGYLPMAYKFIVSPVTESLNQNERFWARSASYIDQEFAKRTYLDRLMRDAKAALAGDSGPLADFQDLNDVNAVIDGFKEAAKQMQANASKDPKAALEKKTTPTDLKHGDMGTSVVAYVRVPSLGFLDASLRDLCTKFKLDGSQADLDMSGVR